MHCTHTCMPICMHTRTLKTHTCMPICTHTHTYTLNTHTCMPIHTHTHTLKTHPNIGLHLKLSGRHLWSWSPGLKAQSLSFWMPWIRNKCVISFHHCDIKHQVTYISAKRNSTHNGQHVKRPMENALFLTVHLLSVAKCYGENKTHPC